LPRAPPPFSNFCFQFSGRLTGSYGYDDLSRCVVVRRYTPMSRQDRQTF
jgi:hypothetical protein